MLGDLRCRMMEDAGLHVFLGRAQPSKIFFYYCYTTIHIYNIIYNIYDVYIYTYVYIYIYVYTLTLLCAANAQQRTLFFFLEQALGASQEDHRKSIYWRSSVKFACIILYRIILIQDFSGVNPSCVFLLVGLDSGLSILASTRPRTVKDKSVAMTRPVAGAVQASGNFHEARTSRNTFFFDCRVASQLVHHLGNRRNLFIFLKDVEVGGWWIKCRTDSIRNDVCKRSGEAPISCWIPMVSTWRAGAMCMWRMLDDMAKNGAVVTQ